MPKRLLLIFLSLFTVTTTSADFTVRTIYLQPTDAPATPIAKIRNAMESAQKYYADEMQKHKFGRKTFRLERDNSGKIIIHTIRGRHRANHYYNDTEGKLKAELPENMQNKNDILLSFIGGLDGVAGGWNGQGQARFGHDCGGCKGWVAIASRNGNFELDTVYHELGHAFGLYHNIKGKQGGDFVMWNPASGRGNLEFHEARWLNKSRYFNNVSVVNLPPRISNMKRPVAIIKNSEHYVRFTTDIASSHDLYQAQIFVDTDHAVLDWTELNSQQVTVDFEVRRTDLIGERRVWIQTIDITGNQFLVPVDFTLPEKSKTIITETIETDRTETYLTLFYANPDALTPTNPQNEWGWDWGGLPAVWEKMPNKPIPKEPHQGFMPAKWIPYVNQWDYWFYAVAESLIVYDLTGGNYAKFDGYFDMPNPCLTHVQAASMEIIFLADDAEIYNTGVFRGDQARNTHISFDIPEHAETLTIRVTDGGDGNVCDHFIIANARLVHGEPPSRKVDPKIEGPKLGLSFSTTTTNVRVGDTFMLHLNSEKVTDLAGWQFGIVFDPAVLEALEVSEGDFLKRQGGTTFFRQGRIDNAAGKITGLSSALISEKGVSGTGALLSVTFSAKAVGETQVILQDFEFGSINGKVIPIVPDEIVINVGDPPAWDVNQDGRISVLDLILVARRLGETASANAESDVNGDGVISILDLIVIAQHMGESTAAAPSTIAIDSIEGLNLAMLQTWIEQAHIEDNGSITFQQGIANLQRLLESLVPKKTTLLANYPNPFNPETWIPYQLAEPAEVSISIYTADGKLVRTLELGHQSVGIYESRSQAAHWDGRNEVGESVASGLYFCTLTTRKFVATRRMLIRK